MPCPLTACIEKTLTMPNAARLVLAACLAALGFVLIMQYGLGYEPCILCLWQRAPYGAAALLSVLALLWRPAGRQTPLLLFLCTLCFLTGMGLAIFHTGVERHWWLGTASCTIQPLRGTSATDMLHELQHTAMARCDEIAWSLFGLTMTNLNIAFSLALAFFSTAAAAKAVQE